MLVSAHVTGRADTGMGTWQDEKVGQLLSAKPVVCAALQHYGTAVKVFLEYGISYI